MPRPAHSKIRNIFQEIRQVLRRQRLAPPVDLHGRLELKVAELGLLDASRP